MFESLPGFRDFYPEDYEVRQALFQRWKNAVESAGFVGYDGPVLESLDLYIEKSGEEIVEQLFHFVDKGGRRVALRPEMTPTLGRMAGSKANGMRKPVKWYNIGDHFRFERPQKGRTRCFTQLNVDILGEAGVAADAESIHTLVLVFRAFGLTGEDFYIRLSDRELWSFAMDAWGVAADQRGHVLSAIDKMERMDRDALVSWLSEHVGEVAGVIYDDAKVLAGIHDLDGLIAWGHALDLSPARRDALDARMAEWRALIGALKDLGCGDYVVIDPGIVRGLAYYTGFVFEAFEKRRKSRALAGGGRYDNLVGKLGGPELHAVGWAMGDVTMLDCLEFCGKTPHEAARPKLFMVFGESERSVCFADVDALRGSGCRVLYSYRANAGFGKQLKEASQCGCSHALIYGSDELADGEVTVKDLGSGTAKRVKREELASFIAALDMKGS